MFLLFVPQNLDQLYFYPLGSWLHLGLLVHIASECSGWNNHLLWNRIVFLPCDWGETSIYLWWLPIEVLLFLLVLKLLLIKFPLAPIPIPWPLPLPPLWLSMLDSLIGRFSSLLLFFSLGFFLFSLYYIKKLKFWLLAFYTLIDLLPSTIFSYRLELSCLDLDRHSWLVLTLSSRLGSRLSRISWLSWLFALVSPFSWISRLCSLLSCLFGLILSLLSHCSLGYLVSSHCYLVSSLSSRIVALFSSHLSLWLSQTVKSIFESRCSHSLCLRGSYSQKYSPSCSSCRNVRCALLRRSSRPGSLSSILRIDCSFTTFIEIMLVSHIRYLILRHSFTREVISIKVIPQARVRSSKWPVIFTSS